MSSVLKVILFFITCETVLGQIPCSQNCPLNETYTDCSAGQFQSTCWKKASSIDFFKGCPSGCVCQPGFTRDPNTFQCILRQDCPAQGNQICPINEEYGNCGFGCDKTCGFSNRDLICRSCFPGCICKKGFVRSLITGQCILVDDCKVCPFGYSLDAVTRQCILKCEQCPPQEFFNKCGSLCTKTCDNPTGYGVFCGAVCNPQCDCIRGYLRNDITKRCILASQCPSTKVKCPANQIFKECGTNCEVTCYNKTKQGENCTNDCVSGCFCKPYFVRNGNNDCVRSNQCEKN